MSPLKERLLTNLRELIDVNGDGKVDSADVALLIAKTQTNFMDDWKENLVWVCVGVVIGCIATVWRMA